MCLLLVLALPALGQRVVPLGDEVDQALLPSGISGLPVTISGQLLHTFADSDGTEAWHVIGEFSLRTGGQWLRSREAVVWVTHRDFDGLSYRHLQVMLWRDAQIDEAGGTVTTGPALFASLSTIGEITTEVDDVAYESSADTLVYRQGNEIRTALAAGRLHGDDQDVSLRVFDPSGLTRDRPDEEPPAHVQFRSDGELVGPLVVDGARVITVIGGVYVSRGVTGVDGFLEIRADAAAVFLPPEEGQGTRVDDPEAGLGHDLPRQRVPGVDDAGREMGDASELKAFTTGFGADEVEGVYLEGDVVLSQGVTTVRADRIYYDLLSDRALILDAQLRTPIPKRNLPLYLRASRIRQLSRNQFTATDAVLTTSEFHTPHYHLGAKRIDLTNRTPMDPTGRSTAVTAGSFRVRHATLNLHGLPVLYWPYIEGNIDTAETSLRDLRTGYSDDFGVEIETDWHLFNALGYKTPEGFDSTLSLDYHSRRGPGVGVDTTYKRDTYYGLLRSHLMTDDEEDFLGRDRIVHDRKELRGRFLLRHRQFLEDDWQVTLELGYVSDRGFLEEFFETEFDNEKAQETLLHLKKQRANWALTGHLQWRLIDFDTQTERLPDFAFHLIGQPLGDYMTWYSENRVGAVRYRPADPTFIELLRDGGRRASGTTFRADSRQEVGAPVDVGPLRLVPFVIGRGSVWDTSVEDGGVGRMFGTVGVRGSMYFSRVFPEVKSSIWDVEGIRHIIKPDITAWVSGANRESDELFPFDDSVEGIDDCDGVLLGLRQRWQTKRGEGQWRRIVDFVTLDVELGLFNDAQAGDYTNGFASYSRPENSITRNHINSSLIWRLNDRTALIHEVNYDMNDGEVDVHNIALAVERTPRFSYLLGFRFIEESESGLLGFDLNYKLTEKHTLAVRELFDVQESRTLDFTVAFIRKFPRWFGALAFELDEAEDDYGVSLSVWPEGLPQAALGSRRFTGLANTTRIIERE